MSQNNKFQIPESIWSHDSVKQTILDVVKQLASFLIQKNKKYGNSAIQPKRIFSRASAQEQINVRIDDKLSRIANRQTNEDEDPELDLLGYLILKRVFKRLNQKESELHKKQEVPEK